MTRLSAALAGALAGAAVATLVTWLALGHTRAPIATAVPACEPASPAIVAAPAPVAAPPAPADPRVEGLAAENVQQAALIANDPDGVLPVTYPAGLPEHFRERTFRPTVEAALRDCAPRSKLDALSCDEPPCIAVIAQRAPKDAGDRADPLDGCAAWRSVYGRNARVSYDDVDCGNGRHEAIEVITPELEDWPGWGELDEATREHVAAREWARVKALLADHHCASAQQRNPVE